MLLLSLVLILTLIPFSVWQVRIINGRAKNHVYSKKLKARWIVLPATPWAMLLVPAAVCATIMQFLFGVNIFSAIIKAGYFTPPGLVVAAVAIVLTIFMWAIALSLATIYRALKRKNV